MKENSTDDIDSSRTTVESDGNDEVIIFDAGMDDDDNNSSWMPGIVTALLIGVAIFLAYAIAQ